MKREAAAHAVPCAVPPCGLPSAAMKDSNLIRLSASLATFLLALGLVACGDDDGGGGGAQAERACDVSCDKAVECGFPGERSECVSMCMSDMGNDSDGCEPTSAEINACIDAFEELDCASLLSGNTPTECDICEDDSSSGPGGGAGMTGGPVPPPGGGEGGCEELRACCQSLPGGGQEGCITTADTNMDAACGLALSTFQSTGLCM